MTPAVSSCESSCLDNCSPLQVNVHCRPFYLFKKLEFVPVASAITAVHRDLVIPAPNAQWPEIQPPMTQGQIVSADPLLLTDVRANAWRDIMIASILLSFIVTL